MNLSSLKLPNTIEIEKNLFALMLKDGEVIPKFVAVLEPDDFYRAEHQIIFRTITRVCFSGTPLDILAFEDELKKTGELERANHCYPVFVVGLGVFHRSRRISCQDHKEKSRPSENHSRRSSACRRRSKPPILSPTLNEFPKISAAPASSTSTNNNSSVPCSTFIVISNFNRTNYAQSVSFESFKESGNIEYTANVVLALQLNLMNDLKGYKDIIERRKRIEEAKKQPPRQINLKCLKNRQGTNYISKTTFRSPATIMVKI